MRRGVCAFVLALSSLGVGVRGNCANVSCLATAATAFHHAIPRNMTPSLIAAPLSDYDNFETLFFKSYADMSEPANQFYYTMFSSYYPIEAEIIPVTYRSFVDAHFSNHDGDFRERFLEIMLHQVEIEKERLTNATVRIYEEAHNRTEMVFSSMRESYFEIDEFESSLARHDVAASESLKNAFETVEYTFRAYVFGRWSAFDMVPETGNMELYNRFFEALEEARSEPDATKFRKRFEVSCWGFSDSTTTKPLLPSVTTTTEPHTMPKTPTFHTTTTISATTTTTATKPLLPSVTTTTEPHMMPKTPTFHTATVVSATTTTAAITTTPLSSSTGVNPSTKTVLRTTSTTLAPRMTTMASAAGTTVTDTTYMFTSLAPVSGVEVAGKPKPSTTTTANSMNTLLQTGTVSTDTPVLPGDIVLFVAITVTLVLPVLLACTCRQAVRKGAEDLLGRVEGSISQCAPGVVVFFQIVCDAMFLWYHRQTIPFFTYTLALLGGREAFKLLYSILARTQQKQNTKTTFLLSEPICIFSIVARGKNKVDERIPSFVRIAFVGWDISHSMLQIVLVTFVAPIFGIGIRENALSALSLWANILVLCIYAHRKAQASYDPGGPSLADVELAVNTHNGRPGNAVDSAKDCHASQRGTLGAYYSNSFFLTYNYGNGVEVQTDSEDEYSGESTSMLRGGTFTACPQKRPQLIRTRTYGDNPRCTV